MNTLQLKCPINQHFASILVVEDDQDDQWLLKIAFGKTTPNLSLYFVSTANEALDFLQQVSDHMLPDLIVTDYNLPKVNGLKLLQHLNAEERYAGIEKVILSNFCHFPGSDVRKVQSYQCFVKPHSFEGMKQLAALLLQLCFKKDNVRTSCSKEFATGFLYS